MFLVPACPLLPEVRTPLGPEFTRVHRVRKGEAFYQAALCYAQSLWREGKPAQAILQINKAFMSDLIGDEDVLKRFPPPYAPLVWMLSNRPNGVFVGNPVRHFQHLATRVSGERKEIRSWRAWACFHLSRRILPEDGYPLDRIQMEEERLRIPSWIDVLTAVSALGWDGEGTVLEEVHSAIPKNRS